MRIARVELCRVCIPFKRRVDHATAARSSAERIFVTLHDDDGHLGFGEIMPRAYLTGETLSDVFEDTAPAYAARLMGRVFEGQASLVAHINAALQDAGLQLALIGGFEAALINLAEHALGGFDYSQILGPRRTTPAGRCVTIGLSDCLKTLRRHALEARMAKATVVKVKVGGVDDVERIEALRSFLGAMPFRLDANGCLSFEAAHDLLSNLGQETLIESFEQPLDAADPDLAGKLLALFREHGIPVMADESICSAADVVAWHKRGGYHIVNVRVGKCGGLAGAQAVIDMARRSGLRIVGGTLVGEAGILDRYGAILLSRTDDMPYMEGLGQARWLLEGDPTAGPHVKYCQHTPEQRCDFTWNTNQLSRWQTADTKIFT